MPPSTMTPEIELAKVAVLIIPTLGVRDPLPVVDIELIRCMCGAGREIGNPSLSVLFERVLHSKTRMATSITSATRPATTPPIKAAWGDLCCSTSSTDCSSSESSEIIGLLFLEMPRGFAFPAASTSDQLTSSSTASLRSVSTFGFASSLGPLAEGLKVSPWNSESLLKIHTKYAIQMSYEQVHDPSLEVVDRSREVLFLTGSDT